MSKITLAVAFIAAISVVPASAGGMSDPVMEPQIIVQDTAGSSAGNGFVQWTILALIITAIAAN